MPLVLVADPDRDTRDILLTSLRYAGIRNAPAATLEEIRAAGILQPRLIVVALDDPRFQCLGVLRVMEQSELLVSVPKLGLTTWRVQDVPGVIVVLLKPIPVEAFIGCVRVLLRDAGPSPS